MKELINNKENNNIFIYASGKDEAEYFEKLGIDKTLIKITKEIPYNK